MGGALRCPQPAHHLKELDPSVMPLVVLVGPLVAVRVVPCGQLGIIAAAGGELDHRGRSELGDAGGGR